MDKNRIEQEMKELETKIQYKFKHISLLAEAMRAVKVDVPDEGENHREYTNEKLALVGDTVLKLVLADKLYCEKLKTKKEINDKKSSLEKNAVLHQVMLQEGLLDYSYNDLHFCKDPKIPGNEKVPCGKHDPYLEAIIAAIYYDSDYETVKKWIQEWLLPLLKKYSSL